MLLKLMPYLSWKYATILLVLILFLFSAYSCRQQEKDNLQLMTTNVESLKKSEEVRLEKKEDMQKLEKKQQEVIDNDEVLIRNRNYFDAY